MFLLLSLLTIFSTPSHSAVLVYSNDIWGEIEPCGCRNDPQGGWDRKWEYLQHLKKQYPGQSLLQVDAGNLFFNAKTIPESLKEQTLRQAQHMVKMMNRLDHHAVTPGPYDFALGLPTFKSLWKKARFTFLASNLQMKNNFLQKSKIYKVDGLKVGVFGVLGTKVGYPTYMKIQDPIKAAIKMVADLKPKTDFIIALTHQGYEEDRKLARKVKGINIIIGGNSNSLIQKPEPIGNTWIYQLLYRNIWVGSVPLVKDFKGKNHLLTNLNEHYIPKDGTKNPIVPMIARFKKDIARINELELRKEQELLGNNSTEYQSFPKCLSCHEAIVDFWRKTAHAKALRPLLEAGQIKNKECLQCHSVGFGHKHGWSNVNQIAFRKELPIMHENLKKGEKPLSLGTQKHPKWGHELPIEELSRYMDQLTKAKSLNDKAKVHQKDSEAFSHRTHLISLTRAMAPVQCENCHGPAGNHPLSENYSKAVKNETCLKCHTPSRAPGWYKDGKLDAKLLKMKRKLIACPSAL